MGKKQNKKKKGAALGKASEATSRIGQKKGKKTKKKNTVQVVSDAVIREQLFSIVSDPAKIDKQSAPLYQNPIAGPGFMEKSSSSNEADYLSDDEVAEDVAEEQTKSSSNSSSTKDPPMFPKSMYAVDPDVFEEEDKLNSSGRAIRDILGSRRDSLSFNKTPVKEEKENGDEQDETSLKGGFGEFTPVTPTTSTTKTSTKRKASDLETSTKKSLEAKFQFTENATPWMDDSFIWQSSSSVPEVHLHNEVVRLGQVLSPTESETKLRQSVVDDIRAVATELFPTSRTEVFGSFSTGLCLPDSDVDLVLFVDNKNGNAIYKLANELRTRSMVDYMQVIDKARVPIIKLKLRGNPIQADICFNQDSGPDTGAFIRDVLKLMPEVKFLTMTIKYYLAQRGLNETFNGGMGSYLCFLTVVSLVQHARRRVRKNVKGVKRQSKGSSQWDDEMHNLNLGVLLLEYFEVYGKRFNYDAVSISLRKGGQYLAKTKTNFTPDPRDRGPRLSIENPKDPSADVGKSTFQMALIRKTFSHAFDALKALISSHPTNGGVSILSSVIAVDKVLQDRRVPVHVEPE